MSDQKIFNNIWQIQKKISSGSFGVVYTGQNILTKEQVAIKLEKDDPDDVRTLDKEIKILKKLEGLPNVPRLLWDGEEHTYHLIVLNLLGKDLSYYRKQLKKFSLKTILLLIDQLITVIEQIHNRSILHRDLKPENILMGRDENLNNVYIIDFGISKIYQNYEGKHIKFKEEKPFIGTTRYASIAAHKGYELGRKDDLESLLYVLIFLYKGILPWQNIQDIEEEDREQVYIFIFFQQYLKNNQKRQFKI
ncbi:protein kinase domain protein [Ichthyophthirius multifiliis]|uniref:Casein kinase I n=1 Tax=Ichthyophthirius multifiliis TaxID=5932 RepID=G0QRT0_ICHMU|nr:protein kinase domain protein [Ichthyophthirius multifiliis]EGR32064.1 protein kinase domain protein [Ichthyophthirius multifiliis]|eukprot:XP_004035550.1 protein kinase domain protein [Ichthyophthirius multifiliis]